MYHPTRGGNRGGKDLFNWEEVKDEHYREYYLGHSLNAPVGRWQKGRDIQWYTKLNGKVKNIQEAQLERAAVKQLEEERRLEALGLKPKTERRSKLSEEDLKKILMKGAVERDEEQQESERVAGLGAAPVHRHKLTRKERLKLEIERAAAHDRDENRSFPPAPAAVEPAGAEGSAAWQKEHAQLDEKAVEKLLRKARKKRKREEKEERRRLRREKKKQKKEKKKEKRREKKRTRHDSSSSRSRSRSPSPRRAKQRSSPSPHRRRKRRKS